MTEECGELAEIDEPCRSGPATVALPGSGLAGRLDARRRAGLSDPDWTLTLTERVHRMALVDAIRAALDDPNLGGNGRGKITDRGEARRSLLADAGLHPCDVQGLTAELRRLVRQLYGDRPPARVARWFSVVDPLSGLTTRNRAAVPAIALTIAGVVPAAMAHSIALLMVVLSIVVVVFGSATYRVVSDPLRLTWRRLHTDSDEVVVLDPDSASYSLAGEVTRDVEAILAAPGEPNSDEVAALLAERDRIIAELVELDVRGGRLDAIANELDEANAVDREILAADVERGYARLHQEASTIAAQATVARDSIEAAASEARKVNARAELDELATPPAGEIGAIEL